MHRQANEWSNLVDDATYIKAMKKFQKETRGILPTSVEYKFIRNKIYSDLRDNRAEGF
jgi:hypothetical protein